MINDLRFALRMIASHPWFAAAIIVTLALGIGVNTTVFTLVNAVLFKPVPVPNGARLVTVGGQNLTKPDNRFGVSYPDFEEFRASQRSFDGLEASMGNRIIISESTNPPEQYRMHRITAGLFTLLQTPPILGRNFRTDDAKPGAEEVLLIGHAIWKNRYGSDPGIVGRAVRVDGKPATIVGVMPAEFKFPNNEEAWMPLVPTEDMQKRGNRWLMVYGMLKRGTSVEEAGADLAVITKRLADEFPDPNKDIGAIVRTFHDSFNGGNIRTIFLTMLGAVGFVLLIACANVANLMLSRAIARNREIAVRAAVGASRWQIMRQLLIESVVLSSLGGLLGLVLALGGVHLFDLATRDVGKPYWIVFSLDFVAFGYFAAISVLSGLLFGLAPALRASRVDLNLALKDGSLGAGQASGGKLTAVLVVVQFALTVVLLAGAGLMVRSFFAAQAMNAFVPAAQIFTGRLALPEGRERRYAKGEDRLRFYDSLLERLGALPGVTHVALTSNLPGLGSGQREIEIEGQPLTDPKNGVRVSTGVHSPGYLAAIRLPIVAGREFTPIDGESGKEAAIVTREFAAKHWPNQPAVGARFRFLEGRDKKPGTWIPVVGVCGDIVQRGQDPDTPPLVFTPLRQEPMVGVAMVVRASGDVTSQATPVRGVLQAFDQDMPLFDVGSLQSRLDRQQWFLVVFGSLFFSFAAIALLMASVGLYAVVAHATNRRTREIGIRMALGATAVAIMGLVLKRGLIQLGIGLVLGLGGAFAAMQIMVKGRLLFAGVTAQDPLVFTAVTALLIAIGVAACWLPARRAARIHPTEALRVE
jgi:predicted permease